MRAPAVLLLVALAADARAQSAEQILKRHADALGGAKALEAIQSTTVTGRVRDRDGRSGTFTHSTARAGRLRVDLSLGEAQWRWGFNGRSAWQSDSRDGLRTLAGAAGARVRNEAACPLACGGPVDAQRRTMIAEPGRVRERQVLVVDTIMPDGFARTLSFDAKTYLLLQQEEHSAAGTDVRVYGDYRRVGRVMVPHEIEWERDGQVFLLSVDRVTHDAPMDDAVFAFTALGGDALPNINDLLADVRRSQERLENVFQSYAHTWTRISRDIDSKGRVAKEDVEVFEVFYLAGTPVRRLVQRNGQPLSAKQAREERERVDDLVRDYERRKRKADADGRNERVTVPLPRGVPTQDRWISGLLRMCELSNLRRERLGGRSMIVAEFEPRRGVPVNDGLDAQMSKTAGVMWIDEQARQVVRTDTHYRENNSVIRKGSATTGEQVRLNDEVWLPSYAEMNLSGQLLFGKSIHRQAIFRQSDYKKFNVDADYKIDTPEPQPRP